MNSLLSPKMMVGAALVGLVSAAGVYIYEQVYAEKRRAMLMKEVANLDKQVTSMRSELETLRELQKESQLRRLKHKKLLEARRRARNEQTLGKEDINYTLGSGDHDAVDGVERSYLSDSEYFTDYQSAIGTDGEMDSEEFYDVPTDEDSDETITLSNGHSRGPQLHDDDTDDDTIHVPNTPRTPRREKRTT